MCAICQRRIEELERHAVALLRTDPELQPAYQHVVQRVRHRRHHGHPAPRRAPGLPADMSARQWAAHGGLDVRHVDSGTSVHKAPRISKQGNVTCGASSTMPALVASSMNPMSGRSTNSS